MAVNTYPSIAATGYKLSLTYGINPGGSLSEVRLASTATGSSTSTHDSGAFSFSASKWPYYAWTCRRSIVWFDLTAYSAPGLVLDKIIRFTTVYYPQYFGQTGSYMYACHDEGDVSDYYNLQLTDYGSWLNNVTILGSAPRETYSTFNGYPWDLTLTDAGYAHLNWGGVCAFVLRGSNDVYGSGPNSMWGLRGGTGSDRPTIRLTVLDSPYVPFKGLFCRGNELKAVFSSPADSISRVYRSPDFGTTWYPISGADSVGLGDVGFSPDDPQKMVIGGSGKLHEFDYSDGEGYYVKDGATIEGLTTRIDADLDSSVAIIGTSSKLYKTTNWGASAYELLNVPVSGVAIGGLETVGYADPPTSGYILHVNGDYDVFYKSGFYGWHPNPDVGEGSYYLNVLNKDATWNPGGTWGYYEGTYISNDTDGSTIAAYFSFDNLTSDQSSVLATRGITEVRVRNYAGRSGYPYGDIEPKIYTHGVYYTAGERGLQSGDMVRYSAVSVKNPNTGNDWTVAEINALVGGCHAGNAASFGDVYLDQVYAEILYGGGGTSQMGNAPLDRETNVSCGNTLLASRPVSVGGTLKTVDLYAATDLTSVRVAVFYNVSGDVWATRGWIDVGSVLTGYYSVDCNIAVQAGDRIGIYASGSIEADFGVSATYDGYYTSSGNVIPTLSAVFSGPTARVISIRGTVFD